MSEQALSTRRDARHALRPGAALLSVPAETRNEPPTIAIVTVISLAGVGFRVDAMRADLETGALVDGARIRIGECEIEGRLAIREVHPVKPTEIEVGALFFPSDHEGEGRLMALIAGIEAAREL